MEEVMAEFVRIADVSELPPEGEAREFEFQGKTICVARANGEITAMDNVCLHKGGPLGQGVVMGDKIVCPWHGWEFELKTGKLGAGTEMGVAVYRVRLEGNDFLVEL
jgi:nitrite reductase (NADH) small subunit